MKLIVLLLCSLAAIGLVLSEDIDSPTDFELDDSEEEFIRLLEEKQMNNDVARENEIASKLVSKNENELKPIIEIDPCEKMHCGAGRICQTKGYVPECVCIPECAEETESRRLVCTNLNVTWNSDCAVHQQRCFCNTGDERCNSPENAHIHIDYYGPCHEQKICTKEDMSDFPRRMREWLFNVMRDMAQRDSLTDHYMKMELEAETNMTRRWSNAAIWKWCDLDGDTDRSISRHELFPIRAPLVSLEHCIAPFLETCDPNKDHRVTLIEWGACLQLPEEDLYEQCESIQRAVPPLTG